MHKLTILGCDKKHLGVSSTKERFIIALVKKGRKKQKIEIKP
jgi:hypothetical protein